MRESLRILLKGKADTVQVAGGEQALEVLSERRFDVVLLDIVMPGMDGLEVLEHVRRLPSPPQVIMLTATRTVKTAVRAMKLGAFDYVTKPFDIDELLVVIQRAVEASELQQEVRSLRSEVGKRYGLENIVAASPSMQAALQTARTVARLKTTVLITGESGTGKEVIAKAVHYNSPRAHRPLVAINCAAIPENLLESELFGHERGAFTDAHTRKLGLFEEADGGTIFLDEIGEMNPATQAKLLRVLEDGTFTRVGGSRPIRVDVRVVAATNRDLQRGMQEGTFRPDLYFRLNVVSIHLAPIRERREDIPLLLNHFLETKSAALGVEKKPFSREARARLLAYAWPGNVREIENVVERALALSQGPELGLEDLPDYLRGDQPPLPVAPAAAALREPEGPPLTREMPSGSLLTQKCTLHEAVERLEQQLIIEALERADHNQTQAAQILGTTRRILKYKMDKLGITDRKSGTPSG